METSRQYSADKTAEYTSGLSNYNNLHSWTSGWIIFGAANSHKAMGITYPIPVIWRQTNDYFQLLFLLNVAAFTKRICSCIQTDTRCDGALLTNFFRIQKHADNTEINVLSVPLSSMTLTHKQKVNRIDSMRTKPRRRSIIVNRGNRRKPRWELSFAGDKGESLKEILRKRKSDDKTTKERGSL